MHDNSTGLGLWPLNPEGAKKGELLAIAGAGVERQTPGGQAVTLAFRHRPEVTRPLEDHTFVEGLSPIDRCEYPKSREICHAALWWGLHAWPKREKVRRIGHALRGPISDRI